MASKKKQSTWVTILLLLVAGVSWYLKNNSGALDGFTNQSNSDGAGVDAAGNVEFDVRGLTEVRVTTDEFIVLEGCEVSDHRNNDGDSFFVSHPEGKDEVRLYFVDTAESRLHKYNGDRIAEQGEYFGGLSQDKTIKVGNMGKAITMGLLKGKKFTMITKWQPVTDRADETRKHAYIIVEKGGKKYYLHEILARTGLVRTKTWGASLPDGKRYNKQRDKVRELESEAKRAKRGAWGMN